LGDLLAAAKLADAELCQPVALEARALGTGGPGSPGGPIVSDVVVASRDVTPGALFACVKGAKVDGHDFAPAAFARGASALLCERRLDVALPQILVRSVRDALGPVSAAFWSHPSAGMAVVGVTGTNGKTTTCALLAAIFRAHGWPASVIGTLTGERTTPDAPTLQRRLAELRDGGDCAVAMEVSSHALQQNRVGGTDFAAGVFNNLSQDHLDYHRTMESYFEAKALLFTQQSVRLAVVNRAGPWGAKLVARLAGGPLPVVTFSPDDATEVEVWARGARFCWRGKRFELNIGGRFNVANAVAAATTAVELGAGLEAVAEGLANLETVKGRFQAVDVGQPFDVVVDFAHTPAALEGAINAARDLVAQRAQASTGAVNSLRPPVTSRPGRVLVVFGAGGDRDKSKRPLMGRVASMLADVAIVTSDNPRSEPPLAIMEEILGGAEAGKVVAEPDRARAITSAVMAALPGDVVLIAGKGHETGQDFGTHVQPFDDVDVAREAIEQKLSRPI